MNDNNTNKKYNINNYITLKSLKNGIIEGFCRICGEKTNLTRDHIPPQSSGNNKKVNFIYAGKTLQFQHGFSCRTICASCNNELLGCNLDREYLKLTKIINNYKRNEPNNSDDHLILEIDVKKILRCIIGHFLATNFEDQNNSIENQLLSEINKTQFHSFVLGTSDFPNNYQVYYWYYPFSDIVINPYLAYSPSFGSGQKQALFGTLIKFFPIACFLVKKESTIMPLGNRIDFNKNMLVLNMNNIIPKTYLERINSKNEVLAFNDKNLITTS